MPNEFLNLISDINPTHPTPECRLTFQICKAYGIQLLVIANPERWGILQVGLKDAQIQPKYSCQQCPVYQTELARQASPHSNQINP